MANQARLLDFSDFPSDPTASAEFAEEPVHPRPHPNKTPLLDLSVDAEMDSLLADSPAHAKIRVQLPPAQVVRHPNFLSYLGSHTQGRGALFMIDKGQVLNIGFSVLNADASQTLLVERFAADVARFLDLPASAVLAAEVTTMSPARRTGILTALGIESPGLRLV